MNVGKVKNFNGVIGEIVTEEKNYVFTYNGLEDKVKNDDLVFFKIASKDSDVVTDVTLCKKVEKLKTLLRDDEKNNKS